MFQMSRISRHNLVRRDKKIVRSDETETQFKIGNHITVTINAKDFKETKEMTVDYDESAVTEAEATEMVNTYFEQVLESIEQKKQQQQQDKTEELKEKIGGEI